jgi:hypothetical protein
VRYADRHAWRAARKEWIRLSEQPIELTKCQNSAGTRLSGGLPAISAELMAPIEVPATLVGLYFGIVQCLEDTGPVGTESAATLQHEHAFFLVGQDQLCVSSAGFERLAKPSQALF